MGLPRETLTLIEEVENKIHDINGKIIFKCISGSRMYNIHNENSDYDIRGIFIAPRNKILTDSYQQQYSDERNDVVYYEVGRFLELLSEANPNILELLNVPYHNILYSSLEYGELFKSRKHFITEKTKNSMLGYAKSQIKKAKGLSKKINNPVEPKKKDLLDFCHIIPTKKEYFTLEETENKKIVKSKPIKKFLEYFNINQLFCGLEVVNNMNDLYYIYYDSVGDRVNKIPTKNDFMWKSLDNDELYNVGFHGLIKNEKTSQIRVSPIPKGMDYIGVLSCNSDGYNQYLKKYKEYWDWVGKRNQERFKENTKGGREYDLKNMAHTVRLLEMAHEIGETGDFNTWREDNKLLLAIRKGDFTYEELMNKIKKLIQEIENVFIKTSLPKSYDENVYKKLLLKFREYDG